MGDEVKQKIYVLLSCIFCTILVTGNLVFQKFINLNINNLLLFEVSVGVLLYPITFIVTDLITEFFGRSLASFTVRVGIICDVLIMGLIYISNNLPATSWSPVSDKVFSQVFSVYGLASIASLIACFIAQSSDIFVYARIKKLTGTRLLWLRCNISTIIAQFIDTVSVNCLLYIFAIIPGNKIILVILHSFSFKLIASVLLSTPIFYFFYYIISILLSRLPAKKLIY